MTRITYYCEVTGVVSRTCLVSMARGSRARWGGLLWSGRHTSPPRHPSIVIVAVVVLLVVVLSGPFINSVRLLLQ